MFKGSIASLMTDFLSFRLFSKFRLILFPGLEFFETSAKENINVKAVFERLVDIICDKMSESLDSDPTLISSQAKGTRLTENPNPQSSGCGC